MAARASPTHRYGATPSAPPRRSAGRRRRPARLASGPSSSSIRHRSSVTKSDFGSIGVSGRRSASNGSGGGSNRSRRLLGIVPPLAVSPAERPLGPHQQGLGGVDRPVEMVGHLGNREPVDVAERQRGPMVGGE